jgi:hypothetical protein
LADRAERLRRLVRERARRDEQAVVFQGLNKSPGKGKRADVSSGTW